MASNGCVDENEIEVAGTSSFNADEDSSMNYIFYFDNCITIIFRFKRYILSIQVNIENYTKNCIHFVSMILVC